MNRHAILIANGEFPHYKNLPTLETPVNDVRRLKDVLESKQRGAFQVGDPMIDRTSTEILDRIAALTKLDATSDFVLIYFSGHGLLDEKLRLHFAANDTDEINSHRRVPFDHVMEAIDHSRCKRVLILLDCCYSGAVGSSLEPKGAVDFTEQRFREQTAEAIQRAAQAEKLESKSLEEGVYVITACSAGERAFGDTRTGLGIFTKHLVAGLEGKVAMTKAMPATNVLGLITVNNLFRYIHKNVQEDGCLQTPRLFAKNATSPDMVVAPVTDLEGDHRPAEFRIWVESSLLENLSPTYVLDQKFRFLHWNSAFQSLIAEPLKLRRGSHVQTFLTQLENWEDEVRPTSVRDFPPSAPADKVPRVHTERLVVRTRRLGLVEFHKLASPLRDNSGNWCVTLNITYAERPSSLWSRLKDGMLRDELWSSYADCYDEIIADFEKNQELVNRVADEVHDAEYCLDVGAGTGSTTIRLLQTLSKRRVHAIDINYHMLKKLHDKLAKEGDYLARTVISHCDCASALAEHSPVPEQNSDSESIGIPDETYDACVMMNVLFALDDPVECLKAIRRVLKYGGTLSLSTSDETTSIERLFREIQSSLKLKGEWERKKELFERALARNREMVPLVNRYTEEQAVAFLKEAGFQEVDVVERSAYVGCVFIAVARKMKKTYCLTSDSAADGEHAASEKESPPRFAQAMPTELDGRTHD